MYEDFTQSFLEVFKEKFSQKHNWERATFLDKTKTVSQITNIRLAVEKNSEARTGYLTVVKVSDRVINKVHYFFGYVSMCDNISGNYKTIL